MNVGPAAVFIGGIVLAAVVLMCPALFYQGRMRQRLPAAAAPTWLQRPLQTSLIPAETDWQ